MMVRPCPLSVICLPTICLSPPNRFCQNQRLNSTTSLRPAASSSRKKRRPSSGRTRRIGKNVAETRRADTRSGLDKPERVSALRVSATFFPILRVRPELGRLFFLEEDAAGRNDVVLLSRWFWQKRFGGDKQIVGRQITLNGQGRTIIGVVDVPTLDPALFVPLSLPDDERKNQGGHYVDAVGRLKPGVSLEQARADMDVIANHLERQYPD